MKNFVFDLNIDGSSKLFCEIIERPMGMKPRPVFLWIPGGGFTVCATEMGVPIQLSLATHGYSVFTMTYPVGENYRFPEVLVLMSKAILMIRANAEEWNIDPNKIVIGGGSAGGFISAAYGAFWNHPEMQNYNIFFGVNVGKKCKNVEKTVHIRAKANLEISGALPKRACVV